MEESLKTIRLIHRVFLATCLTVAFLAISGGKSDGLDQAKRELQSAKRALNDRAHLSQVVRAQTKLAGAKTLQQWVDSKALGELGLALGVARRQLVVMRAPDFEDTPKNLDAFLFRGVPQVAMDIPVKAVQRALARANQTDEPVQLEHVSVQALKESAVANVDKWERKLKTLIELHDRRDKALLSVVEQRAAKGAAEQDLKAANKEQAAANVAGDVEALKQAVTKRERALAQATHAEVELAKLEKQLDTAGADELNQLLEIDQHAQVTLQLEPDNAPATLLPVLPSDYVLVVVSLMRGVTLEEVRVPAQIQALGDATSRLEWLRSGTSTDPETTLALSRPDSTATTLFPMLEQAGLRGELYDKALSDAIGKVDERIEAGRQQVTILGVKVDDRAAVLFGPVVLVALFLYLVVHVRRARVLWNAAEHAELVNFPWLGLRSRPRAAWQLLCFFTIFTPVVTLGASASALKDWSAAGIAIAAVVALGIWMCEETRRFVRVVEESVGDSAVVIAPELSRYVGLWQAETGRAALLVAPSGVAEWRHEAATGLWAHVRGQLAIDSGLLTITSGEGASVRLGLGPEAERKGARYVTLDGVAYLFAIAEPGGTICGADGQLTITVPKGATRQYFVPSVTPIEGPDGTLVAFAIEPRRALDVAGKLELRVPETARAKRELALWVLDGDQWRRLSAERKGDVFEAEIDELCDVALVDVDAGGSPARKRIERPPNRSGVKGKRYQRTEPAGESDGPASEDDDSSKVS